MNAIWLVIVALSAFAITYRFYGAFLAAKVIVLDDSRQTPAYELNDGVDYHPTNKLVLFGHHFAAISGPGPLVGPVLAAQWGYLPGFTWIVVGACLAGAVHDFVILAASVRHKGMSLPEVAKENISSVAGVTTSIATLFSVIAILASVSIVVVNALSDSAWGMFTILGTIVAALITGMWMYRIRPGRIVEASIIGVSIVLIGVLLGKTFAESGMAHMLLFTKSQLSLMLPIYALIASVLPVWVLMCPRDYLSSYMKIGVMAVLAVGIVAAHPVLKMPPVTPFIDGSGPIITGKVWPFLCIVIMCGAVSGFHALISTGTTPKMIKRERDMLPIAFGAMLVEGCVACMALIAACSLHPGDYFAINVSQDKPAQQVAYQKLVNHAQANLGFDIRPVDLVELEKGTNEKLTGRTGGAVTLAVGMARIFANVPGLSNLMSYWYHFIIMFEALFILTLLETGTRVARFVFQETVAHVVPSARFSSKVNWPMNVAMSFATCFCWGYLLYTGTLNQLWTIFGIANQLLAVIALAVGTTYILSHSAKRVYALCTALPCLFMLVTTLTAGAGRLLEWYTAIPKLRTTAPEQVFPQELLVVITVILMVLSVVIVVEALRRCSTLLSGKGNATKIEAMVN